MAQYDYKCLEGHLYTETRKMTEDQLRTDCPECGAALKRIFSNPAPIIFKGKGFYSTGG